LIVNVKALGAFGDGIHNDTAAIQAAIDEIGGTGGSVQIPDGVYLVDAVNYLHLQSNMTLNLSSGAVLKAIPNSQANYSVLRIDGVTNVNVIGGTLQGERTQHQGTSGEWGMGVDIHNSSNITIEGLSTIDMWGDGIYIGDSSTNIQVCKVLADNNRRQGISITSVNGAVVKDSIFQNTNGTAPSAGLDIEPNPGETVNNVQVLNSQFNNNWGTGIYSCFSAGYNPSTTFAKNIIISGNTVNNNGVIGTYSAGIYLSIQTGVIVSNNIVKNSVQDGIVIDNGSSKNTIKGNTVTGSGYNNNVDKYIGNGILLYDNSANNIVTGNTVTGNILNIVDLVGGNQLITNLTY
jgi:parallel beta-helix repeat protein